MANDSDDEGDSQNSWDNDDSSPAGTRSSSVVLLDTPSPIRVKDCTGIDISPLVFRLEGATNHRSDPAVMSAVAVGQSAKSDEPGASSSNIAANTSDETIPSLWTDMIRHFEAGTRKLDDNGDSPNIPAVDKPLLANAVANKGGILQDQGGLSGGVTADTGHDVPAVMYVAAMSNSNTPSTLASANLDGQIVPVVAAEQAYAEEAQEKVSEASDICRAATTTEYILTSATIPTVIH